MSKILNERCTCLLNKLLQNNCPLKIEDLAVYLKVSARTIRYDLDNIDEYLKKNNFPILLRKQNQGISFVASKNIVSKLLQKLTSTDNYHYILSQQERLIQIFYILLGMNDYVTVQFLADRLHVSKTTIQNDIKDLKICINTSSEYIETAKGKGIRIVGDESTLRRNAADKLLAHFSHKFIDLELLRLFSDISVSRIQEIIKIAEKQMKYNFSDERFNNLVVHLIIAVKRIRTGKDIIMADTELNSLKNTPEFSIAASMALSLEKEFKINIPQSEIGYITLHLLGNNLLKEHLIPLGEDENSLLNEVITILVKKVSQIYEFDFVGDEMLYNNLLQHMQSFVYRSQRDIEMENPLLNEIKVNYADLFEAVLEATKSLATKLQIHINEAECGYLCIHFMTSYERVQNRKGRLAKVLLVCATGVGTSKYVMNKLQSMFDFETVGTASLHNAYDDIANKDIDLVISTVPLKPINVKYILVQPFLTEQNISELNMFFAKYASNKRLRLSHDFSVDDVINVVEKYCSVDNKILLRQDLLRLIKNRENLYPSFKNLLGKNRVVLQASVLNWREALILGGNLLLQDGYISKEYITEMLENAQTMGDYMILAPGVAMPHASRDKAYDTGFSLVNLKNPVPFGKENMLIKTFIILAAKDTVRHMQALKDIMKILEEPKIIASLQNAVSIDYVNSILENL